MFIIGILTWQVITTVVYFITGEDDEKTLLCGCGICTLAPHWE